MFNLIDVFSMFCNVLHQLITIKIMIVTIYSFHYKLLLNFTCYFCDQWLGQILQDNFELLPFSRLRYVARYVKLVEEVENLGNGYSYESLG